MKFTAKPIEKASIFATEDEAVDTAALCDETAYNSGYDLIVRQHPNRKGWIIQASNSEKPSPWRAAKFI